ncbi:hypothetical protein IVB46_00875 [Bradyrhizobium sp. 61]|uniref:hypothetical protein n=1 Tax=unclassified Bradyrhizobium TaxID=2631580 RepID=UPI001FF7C650|nr:MULTISPECIES: hypothetical protein [unclassified Bradyrhizobium]MCK1273796.1 hypothetical protein [Bradyrhizobium sp. 61]MCK1447996.1 hypothetical protein [Bradyrhizobium sp. 48]
MDIKEIEDALDSILTACIDWKAKKGVILTNDTPGAIRFEIGGKRIKTRDEMRVHEFTKHPVYGALRYAVRDLGSIAHKSGVTFEQMKDLAERACDRHPRTWSRRMSIIDCWWDGIGDWVH